MNNSKQTIEINLTSKDKYKNPYNENKLSTKLTEYIQEECKGIPYNCQIELIFNLHFELTKPEKVKLINMVRSHFGNEISENIVYHDSLFKKDFFLFLFGCLFIAISTGIQEDFPVSSEIILIIGWVGVWEVIYSLFFSDYKTRLKIKRLRQLTNSKITFNNKTIEK